MAAALVVGNGAHAAAQQLDPSTIDMIYGTAVLICGDFIRQGTASDSEIEGSAEARLKGLAGQLVNLGVEGGGKIGTSEYAGVLREQLGDELQDVRACRLEIWKDLSATLLASQTVGPREPVVPDETPAPVDPMRAPGQLAAIDARWMVILGSFTVRDNAEGRSAQLREAGLPSEVIRTDDYPNLTDGYWAVVLGTSDRAAAEALLPAARAQVPDAYIKSPR